MKEIEVIVTESDPNDKYAKVVAFLPHKDWDMIAAIVVHHRSGKVEAIPLTALIALNERGL